MISVHNAPKAYRRDGHAFHSCQYYTVFCTKLRRDVLCGPGVQECLRDVFFSVAEGHGFSIDSLVVFDDHVMLIFSCAPDVKPASCVFRLKAESHRRLYSEFNSVRTRVPSLWTRDYFISTAGDVDMADVSRYLESQRKP